MKKILLLREGRYAHKMLPRNVSTSLPLLTLELMVFTIQFHLLHFFFFCRFEIQCRIAMVMDSDGR